MDGTPQRPLFQFRVSALILGVVCLVALVQPATAQTGFITNGNFEDGTTGWFAVGDLAMSVDASVGGTDGPSALRVVAGEAGSHQVRSHYWLSGTVSPGAAYGLEAWVRDDDPGVLVTMRLEFVDAGGVSLGGETTAPVFSDAPDFYRVQVQSLAPASSVYARVIFEGDFRDAGASFAVDGVVLAQVGAAPTVEPTQQPAPTPTQAVATATPTPTATPKATSTPKPTPTPKPPPLPIGPFLRVAHDGDLAAPWDVPRGDLQHAPAGGGLLFRVEGEPTGWIEQAVTVIPGAWYEASARLAPVDGVRAAWVRLAWYASANASGAQIETDDSGLVVGDGALAIVVAGGLVTTGPVRAPLGAYSAKVRILLQPTSPAGAAMIIEGVVFASTSAPPPAASPTPTPAPTSTPAATPTSGTATPTLSGGATSATASPTPPSSGAAASPTSPSLIAPADVLAAQGSLRITELMPDPLQPGRDADYEWVELTNLGAAEVPLDGMMIRDAQAGTALPSVIVPPGASVVLAGRLAEVDADVRLDGTIGNGLGNEGDHVELLDAAGRVVDAFDYGVGTGLTVTPGQSVHRWFDAAGGLAGAGVGAPAPGVHTPLVTAADASSSIASAVATLGEAGGGDAEAEAVAARSGGTDIPAWVFLLAVGGGAVGGMAVQRLGQRRHSSAAP